MNSDGRFLSHGDGFGVEVGTCSRGLRGMSVG